MNTQPTSNAEMGHTPTAELMPWQDGYVNKPVPDLMKFGPHSVFILDVSKIQITRVYRTKTEALEAAHTLAVGYRLRFEPYISSDLGMFVARYTHHDGVKFMEIHERAFA